MNGETPKALRVLQQLDLESCGSLVVLDREERDALYESLYASARKAWPVGEAEPDHSISLIEKVVEGRGELAWAAALYALLHDRRTGEGPLVGFERAVLRFKLGHVLFLLAEEDEGNVRCCLRFAEETLRQAEALWKYKKEIPRDSFYSLIFELQRWMGHRYEAIGLYEAAERAYSEASIVARNTTDRVDYTVRMAMVMGKLGKKQKAYELVLMVREDLPKVDKDVRSLWDAASAALRYELGRDPKDPTRRFEYGFFEDLSEVHESMLDGSSSIEGNENFSQFVKELERQFEELPPKDAAQRHRDMVQLAFFLFSQRRDAEAEEFLRRAEALEESFEDELPGLERRMIIARRQQHLLHDFSGAREMYLDLLPDAERLLDVGEKLELYGYVLESLGAYRGAPDCALILGLAEKGCALFEEILDRQPGYAARRRIREVYQRFFEGALLALGSAAYRFGTDTDKGQELLAVAWEVAMAARNPELRTAVPVLREDERRHLRELEDAFHRALHDRLDWEDSLARVHELELAVVRAGRGASKDLGLLSSAQGVSLVFFLMRDLVRRQPTLIMLGRQGDHFTTHGMTNADESILSPLSAWSDSLSASPLAETSRDLSQERPVSRTRVEIRAPFAIDKLLPASLVTLLSQPATPWFLFPDGILNKVPLEMLPGPGDARFGQGRAVSLCLRPSITAACRERVDFSRGWLGLGGAPSALGLSYLAGSLDEVVGLARFLRRKGHPAAVLSGRNATAAKLRARLDSRHPSILHFAVHGMADPEHPDACALILADDRRSPERVLLPFRRIRDLDLSHVGLVILSACRSLIGRSGRAAGMEGLAWAFLQAGATQVIASRYNVHDTMTARFMTVLYEHLLHHPVAEALGHARDECISRWSMPVGQAGAWSVWS